MILRTAYRPKTLRPKFYDHQRYQEHERVREEGTLEKFQWYCENCDALVHEVELQVRDIVTDLPPVFNAFYEDEQARVCKQCGTLHPGKG